MLNTEIKEKNGVLWFDVDGKLYPPYAYMTYCPVQKYIDEFKAAGYKIFSFPIYMCDWGINTETGLKQFCPHIFLDEDKYDFDIVDKYLEMFAPGGKGAFIFPRVYLQTPSVWDRKNPGELSRDYEGGTIRCDYASPLVRETLWKVFKELIDHIESSIWKDSVIGYQIAGGGTEEWAHHLRTSEEFTGYSNNNKLNFIERLKAKYITKDLLNSSWGTNYNSFEEIELPTPGQLAYATNGMLRDSAKEMQTIDFYIHQSEVIAETIMYFANKVKSHTDGKAITGAFYGYIWMFHKAYKGHNALNMLLNCADLDFIASTNGWPEPGLSWPFGSAPHSALLHGKMFMCEGDIRTHLTDSLAKTMPHAVPDGNDYYTSDIWKAVKDEFHSASVIKKAMARVLTSNVGVWWFDMFSGWFSSPKLMNLLELMHRTDIGKSAGGICSEVALILDEQSPYYTVLENGAKGYFGDRTSVYNRYVCDVQKTELGRMGAPYDIYEANDLADPGFNPDKYKMYIFLDLVKPSPKVREAIEERIKKNGRTLVWSYFTDVENNSLITGFDTVYNKSAMPRRASYMGNAFPGNPVSCPRFSDTGINQGVEILTFEDSAEPCIMYLENEDYRSFYSLLPAVPARLLAEMCLMAGVHLYSRDCDVIYAGGEVVAIHSDKGGTKHILFPQELDELVDIETGEVMKFYDTHLFFDMEKDDTRIFKVSFK